MEKRGASVICRLGVWVSVHNIYIIQIMKKQHFFATATAAATALAVFASKRTFGMQNTITFISNSIDRMETETEKL